MLAPLSRLDRLTLLLGQWFGTGLSPLAPGTLGSLGAVPLFWLLRPSPLLYWMVTLLICVLGTLVADRCAALLQDEDPSSVVIDEVAGVMIALGPVANAPWFIGVFSWLLFRLLDIAKPGWIDRLQRLRPPGVGIMADDCLAGVLAGAIGWIATAVFGLT